MPKADYQKVVDEMVAEGTLSQPRPFTNPRIKLDDGRIVWGMTCWWGAEDKVKAQIADRVVIHATLEEPK